MSRRPSRIATAIAVTLLATALPVAANTAARTGSSTLAASVRWAAVARTTASTAISGALPRTFTWTNANRNQTMYQRFDLANAGTLTITGARVMVPRGATAANWTGGGSPSAAINVRLCNNGTWSAGGTCSSGSITILQTSAGAANCNNLAMACTFVLIGNLAVGQERALIMGMTSGRAGTYSLTISAAVDRGDIREAEVRSA